MKQLILFIIVLTISLTAYSQKKKPATYYLMPDSVYSIDTKNDTLWVMTHKRFLRTYKTKKDNELAKEQIELQKKQIAKLKEQGQEKDTLITTLTEDRDFYEKNWNTCNDDIKKLGKISKRQKKITRIVTIVGVTTTVVAFVGGFFLGIK